MTQETKPDFHYFIISDSIGDTAIKFANSVLVQFPTIRPVLHKHTFISTPEDLLSILKQALDLDALVFLTVPDDKLAKIAETFCIQTGLICYNLLQPFMLEITRRTGVEPTRISGAQHVLSEKYFNRVEAMEFCIAVDDGKDPKAIQEAEIVLLGVSRTGKTPLSMYLATLGYKVVNLPILLNTDLPVDLLKEHKDKVVGLTSDVNVLQKHRRNRMIEYGMPTNTRYSSDERIKEELSLAKKTYREIDCPVINVADRSMEESASIIIDLLQLKKTVY